jgi:rare lipoprotein A
VALISVRVVVPQLAAALLLCLNARAAAPVASHEAPSSSAQASPPQREVVPTKPKLDRSGKPRKGKASYYSREFYRKKMASGKPLDPDKKVAASKTLPLGTVAKVTNLETGQSDVVTIEDRGPYIKGRIVDVTPKVADQIGLKKDGVAPVEVKPLLVPQQGVPEKAAASNAKTQQNDRSGR